MNTQDMTRDELLALVAEGERKLEAMRKASQRKLTLKVTEKGAVSMYGMGRFPVTLYRGQWERVLAAKDDIAAFIEANASLLSVKGEA